MKKHLFFVFIVFAYISVNAQWTLEWSDEFNYTGSPDEASWNMENWTPGWVNDEVQAYTDRIENAYVENGHLTIAALKDNYNGWTWTSARLQTAGKHDALYGRIEVRAILPEGTGTWPAIWMLPTDWVYGNWPTCGEIDIMEHVGFDPGVVHASCHTESYNHTINTQVTFQTLVPDYSTAYHVYAIEWTPDALKMFVDDNNYFIFENEHTGYAAWPFDKPFHLILNVAMGGSWGGRIDRKLTSAEMLVDYVRMYSYNAPTDTEAPGNPPSVSGVPGSSSVALTWEPSIDNYSVKQYDIYKDNTLVGSTIWHNYNVSGLDALTNYSFKVAARDYSGNVSGFTSTSVSTTDITFQDIPGIVEAENYDAQFGVQTETTADVGGGLNVGWIDSGDWMDYWVNTSSESDFIVDFRTASMSGGGMIELQDAGSNTLSNTTIPATGDWQAWTTVSSDLIHLPSGTSKIRVFASAGGFNLNWLEFRAVSAGNDTEAPTSPPNLSVSTTTTTADLTWDVSTDNIAVAGYNIYLDGQFVESVQNLSYQFTGLTKRTGYDFGVSAFDATGNESVISVISTRTKAKSGFLAVNDSKSDIQVYPNPADKNLYIRLNENLQGAQITLYNVSGLKLVNYQQVYNEQLQIDMSMYSQGVYILQITKDQTNQMFRIVKE